MLITALPTVPKAMGLPRYLPGAAIPYPTGNPELSPVREREFRYRLVEQALSLVTN